MSTAHQHKVQTNRCDDIAILLGRIAMIALFLPSGLNHLLHYDKFAQSMAGKGLPFGIQLPFPEIFTLLAVAIEVGGPILLAIGIKTRWVSLLMIAFLFMATMTTHRYWEIPDAVQAAQQAINFYKNVGLMGGFLFLFASGSGAFSWDGCRKRKQGYHLDTGS